MNNQNKLIMLNEYEKQITDLFNQFKNNNINLNSLISYLNRLNQAWNSSRVDIKNFGNSGNTVEFIEYGKNVKAYFPKWFSDDAGKGAKIESKDKNISIMFKCISKGELNIILRGIDFRDFFNKNARIPIYLNFDKFTVNDESIDGDLFVWHNNSYTFKKACEDQQIFIVAFETETLFDCFSELSQEYDSSMTEAELESHYNRIKLYIQNEKHVLNNLQDI